MSYRILTQRQLVAEAQAAFGPDPAGWAFRCPNCRDVAVMRDFSELGWDPGRIGQECIGRCPEAQRGCDWAAFGLIRGPWEIEMPDGRRVASFELATEVGGEISRAGSGDEHGC